MTEHTTPTPSSTLPAPINANPSSLFTRLLLIAVLLTLSGLGWYGFNFYKQFLVLQKDLSNSQIQQIKLQETAAQLSKRLVKLSLYQKNNGWVVETESLLMLARQQVLLYKDADTAISLLNQADQLLAKRPGLQITDIRQLIASEREALLAHHRVDKEKIYFKLEGIIQQLDNMSVVDLKNAGKQPKTEEVFIENSSLASRILKSFKDVLASMGAYIRIQQHDVAIEALLTPSEQLYLKHNLRLKLEQSQLAVLSNNQHIYQASLDSAQKWVKKYFFIDPATKEGLLQNLAELSNEKLEVPMPEITKSLDALRAFHAEQIQEATP